MKININGNNIVVVIEANELTGDDGNEYNVIPSDQFK